MLAPTLSKLLVLAATIALAADARPVGAKAWYLTGDYAGAQVTVRASERTAGAIDSIRWKGVEFIDAYDHGRELQSAAHFDGLLECYNPTEAGSDADGMGPSSTSMLTSVTVAGRTLATESRMAFWLAPGATSPACPAGAVNTSAVSDYSLTKRISLDGNVISARVTYGLPRGHERAVFEALTAYLPAGFSQFWRLDPATGALAALNKSKGGGRDPLIIATPDGRFALGVYSADPGVRYGYWRFGEERVSKWNCVFRASPVAAGAHAFRCDAVLGTLSDVQRTIAALARSPASTSGKD
jgi:hypothetical protein